jgi:integrase/recombinase XerD
MSLPHYLQQHYTPETAEAYLYEITHYTSRCPNAAQAVCKEVLDYLGALRTRYSNPSTVNRILCSIKAYYSYLCDSGARSDNPARAIRLRDNRNRDIQLQDLFTTEELERLLHRKERYIDLVHRNKVLMSLLIYQGLHPRELEALQVQDINLGTGSIYVKPGPKANGRELQLKPDQHLLFYQYIREERPRLLNGHCTDALLLSYGGNPMPRKDITKHVKRSFTALYPGRKVNAQTIRQSLIANLLKEGHDLSVVQGFAGHKYPSSTERYRQNDIETLKAAVDTYHPFG